MYTPSRIAHRAPVLPIGRRVVLLVVSAYVVEAPAVATGQTASDVADLGEYVAAYQGIWNTHDAFALSALFSEDADLVMYNLPTLRGRTAIQNFWSGYFEQQERERRISIDVTSDRLLGSGVALVDVTTTTGGRASGGESLMSRRARGTWLLRSRNDSWEIVAMRGYPTDQDRVELSVISPAQSQRLQIRAFVQEYEDAFNEHDPDAVTAMYRDDADLIVRESGFVRGAEAIREWWRAYFSQPRPYHAILAIQEIRMQADDVALLNVIGTGVPDQSVPQSGPPREARGTWVLTRDEAGWRVAALRVLPDEADRVVRASVRRP